MGEECSVKNIFLRTEVDFLSFMWCASLRNKVEHGICGGGSGGGAATLNEGTVLRELTDLCSRVCGSRVFQE